MLACLYMRKYIAVVLLAAFLSPSITYAIQLSEKEYVHFIASTLIKFLQERITTLEGENSALRIKLEQTPICISAESKTPQEKADEINRLEEQRIRGEFTAKILAVEEKMRDLQIKIYNPSVFECGGYGCPARSQLLQAAKDEVQNLDSQKRYLEIELKRQLASVGVF